MLTDTKTIDWYPLTAGGKEQFVLIPVIQETTEGFRWIACQIVFPYRLVTASSNPFLLRPTQFPKNHKYQRQDICQWACDKVNALYYTPEQIKEIIELWNNREIKPIL